jgi:hypothetical protein
MGKFRSNDNNKRKNAEKKPAPIILNLPAFWDGAEEIDEFVTNWLEEYAVKSNIFVDLVVPVQTFKKNVFEGDNIKGVVSVGKILSYNSDDDSFSVLIYAKFADAVKKFTDSAETPAIEVGTNVRRDKASNKPIFQVSFFSLYDDDAVEADAE